MEIIFKEEEISINDAKNILDVYFDTKDENYKKWLMEITPFEWWPFKNYFYKLVSYFWIKKVLRENKEAFVYRLALITWISRSNKEYFYLKWLINWEAKVFFYISRRSLKSKKNILIDKMICIQKWLWRQAIKELCGYYNIYNVVVEPSVYWAWFWQKINKELKWKINITIRYI